MPRRRTKKAFMSLVSLLFALSIGYFAVLPPTSAWFYQQLYNVDNKEFIFGTWDFSLPVTYFADQDIHLPAATKLEDPNEIAFDEAMHIETISATNNSTLPARIYLTVTGNRGTPDESLYYFLFTDSDYDNAAAAANPENVTTTLMDIIRSRKNKYTDLLANIITNYDYINTYINLNRFNIGDGISGLSADEGNYVVIPPEETTNIYIAFWVDYNVVGADLEDTNNVSEYYTYDITIQLSAGQNTDGWFYDGATHNP